MSVTRKKVMHIVEDHFAAAEPIVRAGQRDFFPRVAIYRWIWTAERGWYLDLYELSGPNRKTDRSPGLMTVTERKYGADPEMWAALPDWLFVAMVATRPDWEPPIAQLRPAEGVVEAFLDTDDDEDDAQSGDDGYGLGRFDVSGVVDGFGHVHSDAEPGW
ncbi:hypothetical protein AB0K21_21600 [Streptosporangium sp. NPDC049248]|uniref:hypothetical protein n=1 Tax=Streptosporangium sp. NPDC049248 TaxID=3155651 RepID=UPI0034427D43